MKKVVFIPGFLEKRKASSLIKYLLRKNFKIINFFYDTSGKTKIEISANKLKKFIDKIPVKKNEKISIVAFSVGGLVASYYSKFIDNNKIDKLITIFTPFKGTFWANKFFFNRDAIKQMCPNSNFLKKLNKKKFTKIKQKSFWDKDDFVVGGNSAKYGYSSRINFFLHPFAVYWPPLIKKVKKELER